MTPEPYKLSFTVATLRPELACIMAEKYLENQDWATVKEEVLAGNLLQSASVASAERLQRELRYRLRGLTPPQLSILAFGDLEDRLAICWLSMLKYSGFIMDFVSEGLRAKLERYDTTLEESDYETFVYEKEVLHPEVTQISETSAKKVKSRLLTMLREMGILTKGEGLGTLHRILIPISVLDAIIEDDPGWLRGFLYSDAEVLTATT